MLPPLLDKTAGSERDKWLWALIGVLVVGQVIAFWLLCSAQVRKAEVRHAAMQLEKVALQDCLQYIPKSTLGSCATRVQQPRMPAAPQPAINTATASAFDTVR